MIVKDNTTDLNVYKKETKRKIIGYRFIFARWTKRFNKEKESGNIIDISNDICINKQSIQSVENSIYTKELGDLPDTDKDIREFSCDCGTLYGRFFEGNICSECGTPVRCQYSVDIKRVGWINIEPFYVINPNAYDRLTSVIGIKNLQKILSYDINVDLDGNLQQCGETVVMTKNGIVSKPNIPFANLGILDFKKNFESVVLHYANVRDKMEEATHLIKHKENIFVSQIPVSSLYLRPTFTSTKKRSVSFDKINAIYIKILSNAKLLRRTFKKDIEMKRSLNILFDIQTALQELYVLTIKSKLSGKYKIIRGSILGNRMNFSSRMVIRSFTGIHCGMDKVEISYKGFMELYLLEIINALMRGYGDPKFTQMTVYEVLNYITKCQYKNEIDIEIWKIIQLFLKKRKHNPVLINRPPTMAMGSIIYSEIARVSPNAKDKTLAIPLSSLPAMNADFDGDTLSVYAPKEKCVIEAMRKGLSPKRLIIDRTGDQYFNRDFGLIKDEVTNLCALLRR